MTKSYETQYVANCNIYIWMILYTNNEVLD